MTDSAENTLQDEEDSGSSDPWRAENEAHAAMVMAVSQSAMAVVEQARMVAENALASAMGESPVVPEEQAGPSEAAPQSAPPPGSEGTESTTPQPTGTAPDSPPPPEASPA